MRSTATPTAARAGADDEARAARAADALGSRTAAASRTIGSDAAAVRRDLVVLELPAPPPDRPRSPRAPRPAAPRTSRSPTVAISASVIAERQRQLDRRTACPRRARSRASACRRAPATVVLHDAPCRRRAAGAVGFVARREARRAEHRRAARLASSGPSRHRQARRARARARPPPRRCRARRRRSRATTASPTLAAPSVSVPSSALAGGDALVGRLDAVADRVAHEVQHRIHHPLDQELVDLGLLAASSRRTCLPRLAREVAHHERHAAGRSRRPAPAARASRLRADRAAAARWPALFSWTARQSTGGTRASTRRQRVVEPGPADHQIADHRASARRAARGRRGRRCDGDTRRVPARPAGASIAASTARRLGARSARA